MNDIGEYQRGFEWGMLIGLRAAEAALKQGGSLADVQGYVAEIQDVRRRREADVAGCRDAEDGDIFSEPIAHPADFGLPVTRADEVAALASRTKMLPPAQVGRHPGGADAEAERRLPVSEAN